MVIQAMDLVMTDILGNCCAIVIKHPSFPTGTVLVEALYQVETVAPAELQVHRYLPAALVRCLMDADGHNIASQHEYQSFCGQELSIDPNDLFRIIESQAAGLKTMISQAAESANAVLKQVIDVAMREMAQDLETELHRLTELRKVNANVRTEEIDFLQSTRQRMTQAIHKAALRHDAIRVIIVA